MYSQNIMFTLIEDYYNLLIEETKKQNCIIENLVTGVLKAKFRIEHRILILGSNLTPLGSLKKK